VTVNFHVHGQARTSAFVRQWEKILSPEASARRLGGAAGSAATAASPRGTGHAT